MLCISALLFLQAAILLCFFFCQEKKRDYEACHRYSRDFKTRGNCGVTGAAAHNGVEVLSSADKRDFTSEKLKRLLSIMRW